MGVWCCYAGVLALSEEVVWMLICVMDVNQGPILDRGRFLKYLRTIYKELRASLTRWGWFFKYISTDTP